MVKMYVNWNSWRFAPHENNSVETNEYFIEINTSYSNSSRMFEGEEKKFEWTTYVNGDIINKLH